MTCGSEPVWCADAGLQGRLRLASGTFAAEAFSLGRALFRCPTRSFNYRRKGKPTLNSYLSTT